MKAYAHHDLSGNIRSLVVVSAPKGSGMMLAPKPGTLVTEIDGLQQKELGDLSALREFAQRHMVETHASQVKPKKAG
jgi:hypothetical protein